VTDSQAAGGAIQGLVFYRNPLTLKFVGYTHPQAISTSTTTTKSARVVMNKVQYTFGTQSVDIVLNADGIETGLADPDFVDFVIIVPDSNSGSSFHLDVGYGDQTMPKLGSGTQTGAYYG